MRKYVCTRQESRSGASEVGRLERAGCLEQREAGRLEQREAGRLERKGQRTYCVVGFSYLDVFRPVSRLCTRIHHLHTILHMVCVFRADVDCHVSQHGFSVVQRHICLDDSCTHLRVEQALSVFVDDSVCCAARDDSFGNHTGKLGDRKTQSSQVIELVKTTPVGWVLAIFVGHCMSEQAMLPFELTPLYTLESNFIMHAIFHFCFISVMCRFSDDDRKGFWYVMETILIHIVLDTWGLPSSLGNKVTWTVMTVLCKHFVEEVLLNAITQPDNKTPGIVDVWHKTLHDNAQLLRNAVSRQYEIKLLAFLRSDNREETKKRTIEKKMIVDLLDTVMEQALLENGCENLHNATKQDECLRKLLQTCSCNSTFHGVFFIIVDSILVGVYAWCQYFDWTWAHSVNLALLRLMAVLWYASVEYGPIYKVLLEIARAKSIRNQLSAMMVRATTSRSAVFALLSEQNLNPIPDRRRVTLLHTDSRGDKCIVQCGEDLLDEDAINGKLYCRKCWAARMRMPVKNHAVLIGWGKEVIHLVSPPSDEEKQILCGQCNEVCDRNRGGPCFDCSI